MNKKNLFKVSEGAVLFAFGFCLEDKPAVSLLFCLTGIGISMLLFTMHGKEAKKIIMLTVPFLTAFAITGLLSKRPLLAMCLITNALVSEAWKTNQPDICNEEKGVFLLCLTGFILLSFFTRDLFFGLMNTVLISAAVFGMPLSIWSMPSFSKQHKKDRKRNRRVLQSMA